MGSGVTETNETKTLSPDASFMPGCNARGLGGPGRGRAFQRPRRTETPEFLGLEQVVAEQEPSKTSMMPDVRLTGSSLRRLGSIGGGSQGRERPRPFGIKRRVPDATGSHRRPRLIAARADTVQYLGVRDEMT